MKVEWRKQEKALYLPGRNPARIEVPAMRFFAIDGEGDPNGPAFQVCMEALYSMTWTVKMMPKSGATPEGYYEYSMYPLEAVWDFKGDWDPDVPLQKDSLRYTVMIRQPAFVTPEVHALAREMAARKKKAERLGDVRLEEVTEGLSVQMMHIGEYDDEPESFQQMDAFAQNSGLERVGHVHREIYLSDPRKVDPANRRTVLRYAVREC